MYVLCSDIHCVEHAITWASSGTYFLAYDSVLIRENTDTILSIYGITRIKKIPHFGIFYAMIRKN